MMAKIFGVFVVARAAAVALTEFTHNELGLSPMLIRHAALLCSGVLCGALYSNRFGRRE
jgi:hypothetical protein